jgi:hypothetical protein
MGSLTQEQVKDVVLVAIAGPAPAEAALRDAFELADRRAAMVRIVAAGPATGTGDEVVADVVARWAEKYPDVPMTLDFRRSIDTAVTLVAASRQCAVAFVAGGHDPRFSAVLRAVRRRAHCPVIVAADA